MWKSAFLLYLSTKNEDSIIKTDTKSKILDIKGQINNSRTSFVLPLSHKIEITPFWLLGFIEGEGWFHVKKQKCIPAQNIGECIKLGLTSLVGLGRFCVCFRPR